MIHKNYSILGTTLFAILYVLCVLYLGSNADLSYGVASTKISTISTSTVAAAFGVGTSTPYSLFHVDNTPTTTAANTIATTTSTFGSIGTTTSRACFNTKNTAGSDISFFFSGTTLVAENRLCR